MPKKKPFIRERKTSPVGNRRTSTKKSSTKKKTAKKKTSTKVKRSLESVGKVNDFDDAKWQAEEDLRTLQRAKEIQSNAARIKNAKKIAQDQTEALKKTIED
jgi:hypothetical protein